MQEVPIIDGYRIVESLGEGAVAAVYRAIPTAAAATEEGGLSEVALKVLKPEAMAQTNVVASFQYETRVLSRLDHPGILRFVDSGSQTDVVWAATEVVEGEPLDEQLKRRKRYGQAEAVDAATQIASGLDHLHEGGYVHRDLKPGNLMRTGVGRLVLMDFGTVVEAGTMLDYETGLYGTVPYMAPEQVSQNQSIDGRADIYALGVLLYQMVAGELPFIGLREDILRAHVQTEPPSPSRRARISFELDALILKCLAKDPDHRYRSGRELVAELHAIAAAGPPARSRKLGRLFGAK